jgi:hypothetical protein
MERLTDPRRKGFELRLWQVAELFLDPAQFGNDHDRTGHLSVVAMLPGAEREPPPWLVRRASRRWSSPKATQVFKIGSRMKTSQRTAVTDFASTGESSSVLLDEMKPACRRLFCMESGKQYRSGEVDKANLGR